MANIRLVNRPAKSAPAGGDILFVGDMTLSGKESQSTINQVIASNNITTTSGTPTASNLSVWNSAGVIADSGITVDHSQNITNANWNGTVIPGQYGGTGVANTGKTLTLGGNLSTSGAFATVLTVSAATSVTLPTSGTLLNNTNNLSDISSASTAATNLGLGTGNSPTFTNLTLSGLTASQTVVTNGSKQLVSMSYTPLNTASTIVQRDSSGNFAATTITAALTGAASLNLLKTSNLSDVANKITSFNTISPLTTAGDLIVFDGTNNSRLAGSTTDGYVVTYDSTQPSKIKWAPIPSIGDQIRVINTTTILTSADYGKTIVCQGSSSYTVTLPTAASGTNQFIYFVFDTSQQIFVTVSSQVGDTIIGPGNSLPFGPGEGMEIMTDGSAWCISSINLVPCNMTLGLAGTFTSSSSATTIIWDTTVYKSNMIYNVSNGYVTPIYPGKYECYMSISGPSNASSYSHTLDFNFVSFGQVISNGNFVSGGGAVSLPVQYTKSFTGTGSGTGPNTFFTQYASSIALSIGGSSSLNMLTVKRIGNY